MERKAVLLIVVLGALASLAITSYALPWIEDEDTDYGDYSWAYAYVGAYTNGEKLLNINHEGRGEPYHINTPIFVYKDYHDEPDYTSAYTLVVTFVDPDRDGTYSRDAVAFAHIEASPILGR